MKIVGAPYSIHDHSVCLVEDGEIKEHIELERITKIKHSYISPDVNDKIKLNNIFEEFVTKYINKHNPDIIAAGLTGNLNKFFDASNKIITDIEMKFNETKKFYDNIIVEFNSNKYYIIDHHIAHASYGYFTSKFDKCDIFVTDGGGDYYSSLFIDSNLNIIDGNGLSLGILWGDLAYYSLDKFAAGKLMGLSAYGNLHDTCLKIFDQMLLSDEYSRRRMVKEMISKYELKDIAASLQHFSIQKTSDYLKKYKTSDNLIVSGGVGLNGYINQSIEKQGIYKNVYIPPACGDSGLSIGVALHAYSFYDKTITEHTGDIKYLGMEYDKKLTIKIAYNILKRENLKYAEIYSKVAKYISEGKIVGWYQGRSESGPRALGNRSILADARDSKMKDHINKSIKHREWYRPFAPAILKEYVTEWFEDIEEASYMLKIAKYKKGMGEKVPSTCHIDYTGRLQSVTKDDNLHFYNLISEFHKLTGTPIILNTSFNDNNEPIVEIPDDAYNTFIKNDIDILVIKNDLYIKKE